MNILEARLKKYMDESALPLSQGKKVSKNWDKKRYEKIFNKFRSKSMPKNKPVYRIYLPLKGKVKDAKAPKEIEKILDENGFTIDNYVQGYASKKDKKGNPIKIGKILNKAKKPDLLKQFNEDPKRSLSKKEDMTVVISRHPYDIAGMSTDRGWRSCMELNDGQFKRYVLQDIKEGSLVAYLIDKEDTNINKPISRLLIKPFINIDNPKDIILGEDAKVYGTPNTDFVTAVQKWLKKVNGKENQC